MLPVVIFMLSALLGAGVCPLLPPLLRRLGLERTNYLGNTLCSGGGMLFLLSALPWLWPGAGREAVLTAAAAAGFGILGLIDDRWGTPEFKGLRGHLRALRAGRVTTGLLKAIGGVALALALTWSIRPGPGSLIPAALIALSANLFNLLDLRPLRALKVFWLLGLGLLPWSGLLLPQLLGLSLPYARLEARRAVMLGDTGSNLLGAVIGISAARALPLPAALTAVVVLIAFHLWAEKHSLTAWIERRAWLRALDGWGWRRELGSEESGGQENSPSGS